MFANCRNSHGGGVAIFAHEMYSVQVIERLSVMRDEFEGLFLLAEGGSKNILLVAFTVRLVLMLNLSLKLSLMFCM